MRRLVFAALVAIAWSSAPIPLVAQDTATQGAGSPPELLLILDASGSMWGQIEGENKIVIARRALAGVLEELPTESRVGLIAYGHRREGDCEDIETLVPTGPLDRTALNAVAEGLNPKGKTPITASVREAVAAIEERGVPTTLILISDGLETCGGDPCATVRAAREAGVDFRLHVVGFGIEEGDVSQLECAAQAGGGLYFPASGATELVDALGRAVEAPAAPDEPPATLSVAAILDGEPLDAMVTVIDAKGENVASGRTYIGSETNPRQLPVPPGTYDVVVRALGLEGEPTVRFDGVEIPGGEMVERRADFSSGELAIRVTRDGALSDATVAITRAGSGEAVDSGRTYTSENNNPSAHRLTPGVYDVEIVSLEIEGAPSRRWEEVAVEPGETASLEHDFVSGTLKLGVVDGDTLVDATLALTREGERAASGRTYTKPSSNPKTFVLEPGTYEVVIQPLGVHADVGKQQIEVTVEAAAVVERIVRLGSG